MIVDFDSLAITVHCHILMAGTAFSTFIPPPHDSEAYINIHYCCSCKTGLLWKQKTCCIDCPRTASIDVTLCCTDSIYSWHIYNSMSLILALEVQHQLLSLLSLSRSFSAPSMHGAHSCQPFCGAQDTVQALILNIASVGSLTHLVGIYTDYYIHSLSH